jgi:DNA adenine methylase
VNRCALPRTRVKIIIPPIKCQGIKSKLVPFITSNIAWDGEGRWIEPFLGSGVVLFSVQPERAFVSDINPHLISFYSDIQSGNVTAAMVKEHLLIEGSLLLKVGEEHYYAVRERFNEKPNSLDFLLLSRACFNGLMRFNRKRRFNVPFCCKPDRFRPAYITKIVNQVKAVAQVMSDKDWVFMATDWRECLSRTCSEDFVYLDPPYIGRNTDYYNQWSDTDAIRLAQVVQSLDCGYAMSMWLENRYRQNSYVEDYWPDAEVRTMEHFYHIGSTEDLRNSMIEALLIRPGFESRARLPKSKPAMVRTGALALEL